MPVLMLVAPAGYGKSTILADWTERDERPSAWLTLDERHNDPTLLLGAIASLLDQIEPIGEEVFAPLSAPRSGVSSVVVPRLGEALEARTKAFVLVLDDLHLVDNPDCLDSLVAIAHSVPAGSQIAFASRTEPKLPLGRMRAQRLLSRDGRARPPDECRRSDVKCWLRAGSSFGPTPWSDWSSGPRAGRLGSIWPDSR